MSTLLQLYQRTKRDCKIPGTVPTTAQSQNGILGDLVGWIIDSWNDIQLKERDWNWMYSTFTLDTVASTYSYESTDCIDVTTAVAIARFARWITGKRLNRWKIYLQSAGQSTENELIHISYDQYQHLYRLGANASITGYPAHVAIGPGNEILLGPSPDAVYVMTGEYQKSRQVLNADGDTPEMPEEYHPLIEAEAMLRYAEDQSAPELEKKAMRIMRSYYSRLRADQLPPTRYAGPLA